MMRAKHFRDPIHGLIAVDRETELEVIEQPAFQRLRHIHQLALAYYLYHGADHTRFGHSLGTMELAGRAFDQLVSGGDLNDVNDSERKNLRRLVRLCALVHDLGHSPFSHAGEKFLFPADLRHEDYTVKILSEELQGLIDRVYAPYGITTERVAEVLSGEVAPKERYLAQIISSPLDVDKMDYLLRDAHYCGVRYGEFDLPRIISKLGLQTYVDGSESYVLLGLRHGSLQAFEEFVLARYWMSAQVYYHSVRRQLDIVLRKLMAGLLEPSGKYPTKVGDYLLWNDHRVLYEMQRAALSSSNDERARWARVLNGRRPYFKRLYDREYASPRYAKDDPSELYRYNAVRRELEREMPDDAYGDLGRISNKLYSGGEQPGSEGIPLCVEDADGKWQKVDEVSTVLTSLPLSVTYYRIFVVPDAEKVSRAKKIRDNVVADLGRMS
jgi:HD superfamily phosphohydrolase